MNTETITVTADDGLTTVDLTLITPGPVLQFTDADGNKHDLTGPVMRKLFEAIRDGSGEASPVLRVDA